MLKKLLYQFIFVCFFAFNCFSQSYEIVGNAFDVATVSSATCTDVDTCFALTSNTLWQQGAVWDLDTMDLSQAFDATFCMFIGSNDSGADGFAFVLRGPNSINYGQSGGALGYGEGNGNVGIQPSIGIEYDTYNNSETFDLQEDHTQLVINGEVENPPVVSAISLLPSNANVEDNNFHTSRIVWDPVLLQISMYFDGFLRFTYTNDFVNNVFGGNPKVFWGFTASTGGLSNLQQICFPKISIDIPDYIICETDSVQLHFYHDNLTSYTWTNQNNDTIKHWDLDMGIPLTDTSFYASLSGTYTISVISNNHVYFEDIDVTIIPFPEAISHSICSESNAFNLFDLFTGIPTDGSWTGPTTVGGGNLGTFNPNLNTSGIYIYESILSDICLVQNQVTVSVNEIIFNPQINLIACTETDYDLEINPEMSNGQQNFTYSWTAIGNTITENQNLASVHINSNAQILVEITSNDNLSCEFDTTFNLLFVSNPQFNLGSDIVICSGETSQISAVGNWNSYLWNTNSANSSISTDTAGVFWCEVTNASNCVFRDSIQVQESAVPQITLLDFDTISCNPFLVNFEAISDLINTTFSWDFGDGSSVSNVSNPSHNYTSAGVYDLTITASIFGSCENVLVVDDAIHVLSRPTADFSYEILSTSDDEIELALFNNSINYQNLNWYFNQIDSSQIEDTTYVFDLNEGSKIDVLLLASNDYCSSQILKTIEIPGEIIYYVPNSFTPDGNKFNNEFLPIITEGILTETYHLSIFDRWGELVFESFDFKTGWDGTYNSQLVKEGIYVWKINFTEKELNVQRVLTGHVNLMK